MESDLDPHRMDAAIRSLLPADWKSAWGEEDHAWMRARDSATKAVAAYLAAAHQEQAEAVGWRPASEKPTAISVLARFMDDELGGWVYAVFDPPQFYHLGQYTEWLPLSALDKFLAGIAEERVLAACPAICEGTSFGVTWENLLWCISQEPDPIKRMVFEQKRDRVLKIARAALAAAHSAGARDA